MDVTSCWSSSTIAALRLVSGRTLTTWVVITSWTNIVDTSLKITLSQLRWRGCGQWRATLLEGPKAPHPPPERHGGIVRPDRYLTRGRIGDHPSWQSEHQSVP
jgi:hypothetical protein